MNEKSTSRKKVEGIKKRKKDIDEPSRDHDEWKGDKKLRQGIKKK